MMHDLLGRIAHYGGEAALCLLFVLSIFNLAIISQRVWFLVRRHTNVDALVNHLVPLLRARELPKARTLCGSAHGGICSVALAGLSQTDHGLPAVQQALATATSCERIHLEDKLILLNELGRLALLVGIVGSLFDVLAISGPNESLPAPGFAIGRLHSSLMAAAICPTIGGLLVAIPAWLARSMLNVHVQRILLECEFVGRLICSQLSLAEQTNPVAPIELLKPRRVAA
jgi:biopolymer transport protein ExbB/TolQ